MREIRFRAWDKLSQTMLLDDELTALSYEQLVKHKDGNYVLLKDIFDDENLIYMQYTGLKDKNGKEIYEGDILYNPNDKFNYEIKWNSEAGGFELGNDGTGLKKYALGEFWEVAGNIYENPELLSKSL